MGFIPDLSERVLPSNAPLGERQPWSSQSTSKPQTTPSSCAVHRRRRALTVCRTGHDVVSRLPTFSP